MATQTTTTTPPAYQLPYLQYGLNQAKQQYDQGGTPVVPFSPYSEQAIQGVINRSTGGSPLVGAAQQYAQQVLGGAYLPGGSGMFGSAPAAGQTLQRYINDPTSDSPQVAAGPANPQAGYSPLATTGTGSSPAPSSGNPYLDQTFNQAALATQNQLASQFAGAGRNVGASQGLRSQQLNDLATQIYGGAYNQERQLQQGVLGSVLPLANQDYVDLAQLRGAGSDIEGLAREYASAPGQALDQYLGRVSGNMGQTTSQPLYRNSAGSILGGALLGSQLGSSVSSNPYAGIIGAIGGGILGGYGG